VKVGKPMGLRTPQGQAPGSGLLVRGLFWQPYGVEGAPGVTWKAVYRLPATHEEAYAADVIVMANVDFSRSDLRTRRILRDWVLDGGRLVVLGGSETLGQGGVPNTYIEELLPVRLKGAFEVVRCEPPLELGLGKAAPDAARPALFWRHDVLPVDDAQVLAWAGEHPAGLWRSVGKGRVYVFAGTVLGTGDGACTPFWETPFWAGLIERMAVK